MLGLDKDETVITQAEQLEDLVLMAVRLTKKGRKVTGIGRIDGQLSVTVEVDDNEVTNLAIDANTA